MNKVLASNQTIIWSYYNILQNLVFDFKNAKSEKEKREKAVLVIIMSVTVVETFMNVYFFLLASEEKYSERFELITKEIRSASLDSKIKRWPKKLLGKKINLGSGVGQKFQNLKKLRNKLLHFQSEHNELMHDNIQLKKLIDISVYENILEYDVESCPSLVLDCVSKIFSLVGIPENKMGGFIHTWFGDLSRREIS
jgi:hypothetical protein